MKVTDFFKQMMEEYEPQRHEDVPHNKKFCGRMMESSTSKKSERKPKLKLPTNYNFADYAQ